MCERVAGGLWTKFPRRWSLGPRPILVNECLNFYRWRLHGSTGAIAPCPPIYTLVDLQQTFTSSQFMRELLTVHAKAGKRCQNSDWTKLVGLPVLRLRIVCDDHLDWSAYGHSATDRPIDELHLALVLWTAVDDPVINVTVRRILMWTLTFRRSSDHP